MSEAEMLYVDCDKHGRGVAAVVCRHLCRSRAAPLGFIENSDEPGDYQAWCNACEAMFEKEGEMTEAFVRFNDFALVCESCYDEIRQHHADGSTTDTPGQL